MKGNFKQLTESHVPLLVDFYAEWCGPCKMMHPIFMEVQKQLGDKVRIIKIDVDKNPQLAAKYNVRGVPALFFFKEGEILWQQSGVLPTDQLIQKMKPHL